MATYDDLPLTNFPDAEDDWARMSDATASLMSVITQYNNYYASGDIDSCNELLESNPTLLNTIFNADKWNKIRDAIIALERYYLEEVETFIETVGQNTIGINDNPDEDEKVTNAYSAKKIDEIISDITGVKTVWLPQSGWSSDSPYSQTVSVSEVTSNDKPIISVYIYDGLSASEVKARNKAYSCIDRADTGDGEITFYCYNKKPATGFNVAIKGV